MFHRIQYLFLMLGLLAFNNVLASYTTPKPFMNLFYDFTGSTFPGYPSGKVNASDLLLASLDNAEEQAGPLVIVYGSDLYVYEGSSKKLLLTDGFRAQPDTGFFEITAISHIGPALSYIAKAKDNGSTGWRANLVTLLENIQAVRALNAKGEWLQEVNAPSWAIHRNNIQNMVDYACAKSGNYIVDVLNGQEFTLSAVQTNFLGKTSKDYPISYNDVMIGTFMLDALNGIMSIHDKFQALDVNWPAAKVLIHSQAGANVTAGLSVGSNWIINLIKVLSNNKLPDNRVFISAYAEKKSSLGAESLTDADYDYYANNIWGKTYTRTQVVAAVFNNVDSLEIPPRPALPGDYGYTAADDGVGDFMKRLKFSLGNSTEMLSNAVGFWLPGELSSHNWDLTKTPLPGFNSGLPGNVNHYPKVSPEIAEVSASS